MDYKRYRTHLENGHLIDIRYLPSDPIRPVCPVCAGGWRGAPAYHRGEWDDEGRVVDGPRRDFAVGNGSGHCSVDVFGHTDNIDYYGGMAQEQIWQFLRLRWLDQRGWPEREIESLRYKLDIDMEAWRPWAGRFRRMDYRHFAAHIVDFDAGLRPDATPEPPRTGPDVCIDRSDSPLSMAVSRDDADGVRRAIADGADPDLPISPHGTLPIESAACWGRDDVVQALLDGGAAVPREVLRAVGAMDVTDWIIGSAEEEQPYARTIDLLLRHGATPHVPAYTGLPLITSFRRPDFYRNITATLRSAIVGVES